MVEVDELLESGLMVAEIVALVGALNWGLVAFADLNLVTQLFSDGLLAQVVYAVAGIGGAFGLYNRATE